MARNLATKIKVIITSIIWESLGTPLHSKSKKMNLKEIRNDIGHLMSQEQKTIIKILRCVI